MVKVCIEKKKKKQKKKIRGIFVLAIGWVE